MNCRRTTGRSSFFVKWRKCPTNKSPKYCRSRLEPSCHGSPGREGQFASRSRWIPEAHNGKWGRTWRQGDLSIDTNYFAKASLVHTTKPLANPPAEKEEYSPA